MMELEVGVIMLVIVRTSVSESKGVMEEEGVTEVECGDGEGEDGEEEEVEGEDGKRE